MKFIFRAFAAMAVAAALWAYGDVSRTDPSPHGADGGRAQRIVAIIDYIGADYGGAVRDGRVIDPAEYDEQLAFATELREIAAALADGSESDGVQRAVDEIDARVRARGSHEAVADACRRVREAVIAHFRLRTGPAERPSLIRAKALYADSCAACHGDRGDARTRRGLHLDPPAVSFKDPERRAVLSPYRVYNTLTFGVHGTAMPAFDVLSPADRWSLAFFVMRLGHEDVPMGAPASMALSEQAVRYDREVLAHLRAKGQQEPERTLAFLRREAAFQPPAAETRPQGE